MTSSLWKLLANHLTRDRKIIIHSYSCIILYIIGFGSGMLWDRVTFQYKGTIIKIRRPHDCLIFIIGIPILVRWHFDIEMGPWLQAFTGTNDNPPNWHIYVTRSQLLKYVIKGQKINEEFNMYLCMDFLIISGKEPILSRLYSIIILMVLVHQQAHFCIWCFYWNFHIPFDSISDV